MLGIMILAVTVAGGCVTSEEEGLPEEISSTEVVASDDDSAPADPAAFGNTCRNTEIIIENSRYREPLGYTTILVYSVEYYSASEGRWYSESLPVTRIDYGLTATIWNQDLAHAENDLLTKWRVHYKILDGSGPYGWSQTVYQEIDTPNQTCLAGSDFRMTVN
jgi:hypothetical protein